MIADPATAPKRIDLPFLRRRALPKPAAPAVADFIAGRVQHPPHQQPRGATPPPASLDLNAPGRPPRQPPVPPPAASPPAVTSSSLDLDAPARGPQQPPAPPAAGPPSAAARQGVPSAPSQSSSLDLDATPAAAPVVRATRPTAAQDPRLPAVARVRAHEQRLLNVKAPTVSLTRLQSGVGTLVIEAVTSVPHLRIGCAYQLANGATSTVQLSGGNRFGPPTSRRPVIVAHREEYEQLTFDLRQIDKLERAIVYAFSDDGSPLTWGGTLVTTTYGGGRIELALDTLYAGAVAVPLSVVNVAGELWVRAEMENIAGAIRDACRSYGFDRITWRDESTPAD